MAGLLVRPRVVTHFDDPENPMMMDSLVTIMGGGEHRWRTKLNAGGGGVCPYKGTDILIELPTPFWGSAKAAGKRNCMAVACPMCQLNLDLRQSDTKIKIKNTAIDYPSLFI